MPKQRPGLGRGLSALIPGAASEESNVRAVSDDAMLDTALSSSAVSVVPVEAITPNPLQPRAPLGDDEQLRELTDSIQRYGLLQPLLVAVEGEDEEGARYQLIAGERRWRAARLAGLDYVPAVIREVTPQLMLELALVENLQRTDLNPLEEAQGYLMLIEEYGLTQEQVAERIGRNRATVANTIRLLQLPEEVRNMLITMPQVFTEGHARAVLQIHGEAERIAAAQQIIAQNLTVRVAEELARKYNQAVLQLGTDRRGGAARAQSPETRFLEEEFTRAVEMKVRLQRTVKGKGSLTLFFTNEQQLQTLYERLVGMARALSDGHDAYDLGMDGADTLEGVLEHPYGYDGDGESGER
jgi:ParB family chromosome partitioning protein